MAERTRIAVVDDHQLLAQMLADRLADQRFEALVIDLAETDLLAAIVDREPDIVLLDAVFADDEDGGLRLIEPLCDAGTDVVMLTGVADQVRHAEFVAAGALTVVPKQLGFDEVVAAVVDAATGADPLGSRRRAELDRVLTDHRSMQAVQESVFDELTDREFATLQSLVDGMTVEQIAEARTVASSTVRSHVRSLLRKLGASCQLEAVAIAGRAGLRPRDLPDHQPSDGTVVRRRGSDATAAKA